MPYHVFTSYAHADNRSEAGDEGFVTACVEFLELQLIRSLGSRYAEFCDEKSGRVIFRDREGLGACDQWKERMLRHVRVAPVHLVFASEAYFSSPVCVQEWCQYRQFARRFRREYGVRYADSGVVVIDLELQRLSEPPRLECECLRQCAATWTRDLAKVHSMAHGAFGGHKASFDNRMRERARQGDSPGGPLSDELPGEAQKVLVSVAAEVAEYLVANSERVDSPTNCRLQSRRYVDRLEVMSQITYRLFGPASRGSAVLLYGLGGLGKTELAVSVSREYAPEFPAGRWIVNCADHSSIEMALTDLTNHPVFVRLLEGGPAVGRTVETAMFDLHEMHTSRRVATQLGDEESLENCLYARGDIVKYREPMMPGQASMLLICDDVDNPQMMRSILDLANRARWLRILVTSRSDHTALVVDAQCAVEIPEMTHSRSVEFLHRFVPPGMPNVADGAAEVAELLDGFTLVLEQAGAYIENSRGHESYRDYWHRLKKHGPAAFGDTKVDALPAVAARIEHQQRLLYMVLETTCESIEASLTGRSVAGANRNIGQMVLETLRTAALLPADHISWSFLRGALTRRHGAGAIDEVWVDICTALSQHQLIRNGELKAVPDVAPADNARGRAGLGCGPSMGCSEQSVGVMHSLIQQFLTDNNRGSIAALNCDNDPSSMVVKESDWRYLSAELKTVCQKVAKSGLNSEVEDPVRCLSLGKTLTDMANRLPAGGSSDALCRRKWLTDLAVQNARTIRVLRQYSGSDGWVAMYELVVDHWRQLVQNDPQRWNLQRHLGRSLSDLAWFARAEGDLDRADALYGEVTGLWRQLVKQSHGRSLQWRRELGVSLCRHAQLVREIGNLERADTLYAEAVTINWSLTKQASKCAAYRRDLGVTLNDYAQLVRERGDVERADVLYEAAENLKAELLKQNPTGRGYLRDIGVTLNHRGRLRREMGDRAQADDLYRNAVAVKRRLVEEVPGHRGFLRDLGVVLTDYGWLAREVGDFSRSDRFYAEAIQLRRGTLDQEPHSRGCQRDLAIVLDGHARLLREIGETDRARALYMESLRLNERLLRREPNHRDYRWTRAITLSDFAELLWGDGDVLSAAGAYEKAVVILRSLIAASPGHRNYRRLLGATLGRYGAMTRQECDYETSAALYAEAERVCHSLVDEAPNHGEHVSTLGHTITGFALLKQQLGDCDEAEEACQRAERTWRKLMAKDPTHRGHWEGLRDVLTVYAGCLAGSGREERAAQLYAESLELAASLVTLYGSALHVQHLSTTCTEVANFMAQPNGDQFADTLKAPLRAAQEALEPKMRTSTVAVS